ncbi:hypothetical protein DMC14_001900 [Metamycoplasma phocicerebrale]|uniref:Uncharacterized protein n=1 Tax=Metamycoplasma phocicerebrale TaxID=142649 RepID=A0A3T0TUA1_9BACT|nr:hypothetical protein [Metamycoplasma phocicerebrale]AZZ65536.1 hypothetical protein DMC14_001900 [Metamycoplasma phocicerebrale]
MNENTKIIDNKELNKNLILYFDEEAIRIKKKIKFITIFQILLGTLIFLLNLAIVGLAIYALVLGQIKLAESKGNINLYNAFKSSITTSIIVAFFTLLLFMFVVAQSIYKILSKTYTYKRIYKSLEYIKNLYIYDKNFTERDYEENLKQIIKIIDISASEKLKKAFLKTLQGENND